MKMKDLIKKVLVLSLLFAVIGAFMGCADNNSKDSPNETHYTVKYKDYVLFDESDEVTKSDIDKAGFQTPADYSIDGTTVTLTGDGFDKFLDICSEEAGEDVVAIVVYQNKMIMPITSSMSAMTSSLVAGTHYNLDTDKDSIIVLTEAGYLAGEALCSQEN